MDVLPQLIERIEALEKHLDLKPANALSVATLTGTAPAVDESAAPATKLDLANATGAAVLDSTSQPGAPVADVTADTSASASTSGKKK